MIFSSLIFIFIFMPIFFIVYYLLPNKLKNLWICISGMVFYVYGVIRTPLYLLLFLCSILVNYLVGLEIHKGRHRKESSSRLWLIAGLVYNFGWLFIFKYSDFVFYNLNHAISTVFPFTSLRLPAWKLALPLGISFYTFEAASYLIDVYKGRLTHEKSLFKFSTYLLMFPQLISGPITSYSSLAQSIEKRNFSMDWFDSGLKEFTLGLGLKVILANQIGHLWHSISTIGFESISTPLAWMGIVAFSLQLYFDFYGYSLMALGLGRMMGFELPENFKHPYMALSMTEFWRKWHITLGTWFRKYVYIPLGGSHNGILNALRNMLVVWLLTGIWHGASWNFIIWGLFLFFLMLLEKLGLKKLFDRRRILGHIYMIIVIPISWLIFAVSNLRDLWIYICRLFPFISSSAELNIYAKDFIKYGKSYGLLLIVGMIFSTSYPRKIFNKIKDRYYGVIILLAIFAFSIYFLYKGMNDPFMYFNF